MRFTTNGKNKDAANQYWLKANQLSIWNYAIIEEPIESTTDKSASNKQIPRDCRKNYFKKKNNLIVPAKKKRKRSEKFHADTENYQSRSDSNTFFF